MGVELAFGPNGLALNLLLSVPIPAFQGVLPLIAAPLSLFGCEHFDVLPSQLKCVPMEAGTTVYIHTPEALQKAVCFNKC